MTIAVVVAEDHPLVRELIQAQLAADAEVEVVAVCSDVAELCRAIGVRTPDVVITDNRLPPTFADEGIRLANGLGSTHPEVGVVVVSNDDHPAYAGALLEGSARRAYLLKERLADPGQLLLAVRAAACGQAVVGSEPRTPHSPQPS